MDRMYALQRHVYDATRKYYLLGRDRLIRDLAPPSRGSVLEIGCGTGRNLIAAARRWPDARFYGLDISEAMLATARTKIARAGLSDRITLAQGDATDFDAQAMFGRASFDRVFQSYTLSMIPDWQAAIVRGAAVVAPGGRLALVDFGQQEGLPRWWRTFLLGWLDRWHVTPRANLRDPIDTLGTSPGWSRRFTTHHRGYAWSAMLERAA